MAACVALLMLLGGGALFAQAAKHAGKTPTTDAAASRHKNECKRDADCALVPDDCCSCNEGGKQHAVPTRGRDAYESARKKRCAGTMCPQMMSQDPSCAQTAVCRAGRCQLASAAAQ